ncbi:hypothetical protein ISS86_02045 [Candidatus Microgenomates bacterium]|nr:hypothetical protein [Candidatus Microgenomates bacterium]
MEFKGIDVPPSIRGRIMDWRVKYDAETGKKKRRFSTEKPLAVLRVIDRLQKTAERRLLDFRANCWQGNEFGQIPGLRYEYEIWKQGKTMSERPKKAVKMRPVSSPLLRRQPKPVLI